MYSDRLLLCMLFVLLGVAIAIKPPQHQQPATSNYYSDDQDDQDDENVAAKTRMNGRHSKSECDALLSKLELSLLTYLYIYVNINLISIYLSIYQSINQSIHLFIYLSIYPPTYLTINLSTPALVGGFNEWGLKSTIRSIHPSILPLPIHLRQYAAALSAVYRVWKKG